MIYKRHTRPQTVLMFLKVSRIDLWQFWTVYLWRRKLNESAIISANELIPIHLILHFDPLITPTSDDYCPQQEMRVLLIFPRKEVCESSFAHHRSFLFSVYDSFMHLDTFWIIPFPDRSIEYTTLITGSLMFLHSARGQTDFPVSISSERQSSNIWF